MRKRREAEMFNPDDKSISCSAEVKHLAGKWIDEQKAKGDDSIPSLSNLVNQLLLSFLLEVNAYPEEYLLQKNKALRESARRVAVRNG